MPDGIDMYSAGLLTPDPPYVVVVELPSTTAVVIGPFTDRAPAEASAAEFNRILFEDVDCAHVYPMHKPTDFWPEGAPPTAAAEAP